jgi:hypothetical protein
LSLEDLATLPATPPEISHVSPPAGVEIRPRLDSLSLEELLSPGAAAPPVEPEPEPAPQQVSLETPVFDLSDEVGGPSLPLVEVGAGEPPAIPVEDLLTTTGAEPPDAGLMGMGELELDLLSEPRPEEVSASHDLPGPIAPLDLEALSEVPLAEAEAIAHELHLAEDTVRPVEPPPPMAAPVPAGPEPPAPAPGTAPGDRPIQASGTIPGPDIVFGSVDVSPLELASLETLPSGPPGEPRPPVPESARESPAEMAMMRQAVTERVAHALARDLSDKLLERIERIVWEVVPDLAEILITKEIERIRAMAEGKQSS